MVKTGLSQEKRRRVREVTRRRWGAYVAYAIGMGVALWLIFAASFLWHFSWSLHDPSDQTIVLIHAQRVGMYLTVAIGLCVWAASIIWRIPPSVVRKLFFAAAMVLLAWVLFRLIKASVPSGTLGRHMWYLFYSAQLASVLIAIMLANRLGNAPKPIQVIVERSYAVIAAVMALTVLTNDLHQWVIIHPNGYLNYTENPYILTAYQRFILIWMALGVVYALAILIQRGLKYSRKRYIVLLLTLLSALTLYLVAYSLDLWVVQRSDFTVVSCVVISLLWEITITSGIVPHNRGYADAVANTTVPLYLLDAQGTVNYVSLGGLRRPPDAQTLSELVNNVDTPTLRKEFKDDSNITHWVEYHATSISSGTLVWESDITELMSMRESLQSVHSLLDLQHKALERQRETDRSLETLRYHNQLTSKLSSFLRSHLQEVEELAQHLSAELSPHQRHVLLRRIKTNLGFTKCEALLLLESLDSTEIELGHLVRYLANCCTDFTDDNNTAGVFAASYLPRATPHTPPTQMVNTAQALTLMSVLHQVFSLNLELPNVDVLIRVNAVPTLNAPDTTDDLRCTLLWDGDPNHLERLQALLAAEPLRTIIDANNYTVTWDDPSIHLSINLVGSHV
ncbi:MAG: hypothetical protein Q4G30_01435 [Actinomycetaceae bacterium]|nr:hypothetical protein [Actinomycetaceae bacterium]